MAKEKINIVLQGVNNTKKQFAEINHALSVLDRKTKFIQNSFMGVAKASTVALGAIGVAVGTSTAKIDRLVKTSQKLGIGVEFLQKFRFASEQVGIKTETADMALQRFSRRVAEARKGTGEAKDTLTALGISLFDSAGKARAIEDVLFDVSDAMSKTSDASEMVRQSFKFFDSEGVALVALMKNGSDAMKEFFRDAENLGAVLTQESAQGVADFADEMTRLKTGIGGIVNQFTAGLAPALEKISSDFTDFVIQLNKDIGDMGFENLGQYLATEFLQVLDVMLVGFQKIFNVVIGIANTARDIAIGLGVMEEPETVKKLKAQLAEMNTMQAVNNRFKNDGKRLTVDMVRQRNEEKRLLKEQIVLEMEKARFQQVNFQEQRDYIDEIRKDLLENPIDPTGGTTTSTGDGDTIKKPAFIRNMELALENFNKETVDQMMTKSFENAFKSAEDAMLDFIKTGKLSFKDMVQSILADLARIQIRKGITNLAGSFGIELPSADGGGFTGLGARAGGIDGKGGFPAILHPNETVVDHTKGQGMGASITFNVQATDASGFDELLVSRKNQIVAMISQAMNQKGKAGLI